jgi:hypothetical protein
MHTDTVSFVRVGAEVSCDGIGEAPYECEEEDPPGAEVCFCENPDGSGCERWGVDVSGITPPGDHTLTLSAGGGALVWDGDQLVEDLVWTDFQECAKGAVWDADLDIVFTEPGVHEVMATTVSHGASCTDTALVNAYGVDLSVEIAGGDDEVAICFNSDDDDNSGTADYTQSPPDIRFVDDDLVAVSIRAGGAAGDSVDLTVPGNLLAWTTQDKEALAPLSWPMPDGSLSTTVYVEGVVVGQGSLCATLTTLYPFCSHTESDEVYVSVEGLSHMAFDRQLMEPGVIAQAIAYPLDTPVTWSIEGDDYGYAIDGEGMIRAGPGETGDGMLTVVATMIGPPGCQIKGHLRVGAADICEVTFGKGAVELDSVNVQFRLGRFANGDSAGALSIFAEVPSRALSTPAALTYSTVHDEVDVIEDEHGLRQVLVPQGLADIEYDPFEPHFYLIHFYKAADVASFNGQTYDLIPGAQPLVTWQIKNPTPQQGFGTLWVSKLENEQVLTRYAHTYSAVGGETTWELAIGDDLDVYRTETATWDSDIHRTYQIVQDGGTIFSADETYALFGTRKVLTQRIVDPGDGGAGLTTTFDYYTEWEPRARLKWIQRPDGSWRWCTYYSSGDFAGRLQAVYRSWKDIDLPVDPEAAGARKALYEYDPVNLDEHRPIVRIHPFAVP